MNLKKKYEQNVLFILWEGVLSVNYHKKDYLKIFNNNFLTVVNVITESFCNFLIHKIYLNIQYYLLLVIYFKSVVSAK